MFKDYKNDLNVIHIQNNDIYNNIINIGLNNCESIVLSIDKNEIEYLIIDRLENNDIIYLLGIDIYAEEDEDFILIEINSLEIKIFSDNDSIYKFFELKDNFDNDSETIGKLEFENEEYILSYKDYKDNKIENNYLNNILFAIKNLDIRNPELN